MKIRMDSLWRRGAWGVLIGAVFTLSACVEAADEEVLRKLNTMGASKGNVFTHREDLFDAFVVDENNAWVVGGRGLILHVTNKGQDFTMLPSGVQRTIYEIDFVDTQAGVAVGQDGLILKTIDGGKTWKQIPIELPLQDWEVEQPHFFALSRGENPQNIWAVGPIGTIVRSQDGGETWENLSLYCDMGFENFATAKPADDPESTAPKLKRCDVNLNGVSFANDLEGWTAGEFGVILRTRDGGENWEKQANVHNLPKYTRPSLSEEEAIRQRIPPLYLEDLFLIDVDFRNAQEGYVTGESGILLKTEDAGETWTNIPSGSFNTLLSISAAPSGYRSDVATGVLGTLSSGKSGSWQLNDEVRQNVLTWIRTTSFAADGRFGVACGGKGTVLITTDGGNSWKATDKMKLYATNSSLPALSSPSL